MIRNHCLDRPGTLRPGAFPRLVCPSLTCW